LQRAAPQAKRQIGQDHSANRADNELDFWSGICYGICHEHGTQGQTLSQWPQSGRAYPREFELPGDSATIRKEDGRLIIEPAMPGSLLEFLATLEPIEETIGPIDDLPAEPVDL
jgi:antitoxin VapB